MTSNKLIVTLVWEPNEISEIDFDLDLSAFMLDKERKLPSDDFHVFFNNLRSPDSALVLSGDDISGRISNKEGNEVIYVDLAKVDENVNEIVFTATINNFYLGLNFGYIRNSCIRIKDAVTGGLIVNYELQEDFSDENAVEFIKLYRTQDRSWEFDVIGQGYQGSLYFFGGKFNFRNAKLLTKNQPSYANKKENIIEKGQNKSPIDEHYGTKTEKNSVIKNRITLISLMADLSTEPQVLKVKIKLLPFFCAYEQITADKYSYFQLSDKTVSFAFAYMDKSINGANDLRGLVRDGSFHNVILELVYKTIFVYSDKSEHKELLITKFVQ